MKLNWDDETLLHCLGYLANPILSTRIEFEVPLLKRVEFELKYRELTGQELYLDGKHPPYYVVPKNKSKFGIQGRIYFEPKDQIPPAISEIVKSARRANERRINRTELALSNVGIRF